MNMRIRALLLLALVALTASAKDKTSYVFKRSSGGSHIRSSGSLDSILRIAKKWDGPFIWMQREDGRAYLIRDAATLDEAHAAFRDLDALHPKHEEIARRLRPFERRAEEIEEQMDAISDNDDADDVDRAKLRELRKKYQSMEEKARAVEQEMEDLEEKMDALEEIAEKRLDAIVDRAIRIGLAQRVD